MQSAVAVHENSKGETYALRAKCSTILNPAETENGSFRVCAETRKSPVIWGFFVFLPSRISPLASFQAAISPLSRELWRVPEVLEHLSVFGTYCYPHCQPFIC